MISLILSFLLAVFSAFFLVLTAIAFFRARDVFGMTKVLMMGNFYVFPILLFAIYFENFSLATCFKIVVVIVLNCIFSILLSHIIIKKAVAEGIMPDEA